MVLSLRYWGACLILAFLCPTGSAQEAQQLDPGESVERRITPGETHGYRIDLPPGNWLVQADQRGEVDVDLRAEGPNGYKLDSADSPIDRLGVESLLIRTESGGSHRIWVSCLEEWKGVYEIRFERLPEASPQDRSRLAAEAARMQGAQLYSKRTAEARRQAIESYRQELSHWSSLGFQAGQARALHCIAVLYRLVNQLAQALEHYSQALPLWEALQHRAFQASALNDMGLCQLFLRQRQKARQFFEQAIPLYRQVKDGYGEAASTLNLCFISQAEGQRREAMGCYEGMIESIGLAQAPQLELAAQLNLSGVYDSLGRPQQALDSNQKALELLEGSKNSLRRGQTLNNRARLYRRLGENDKALLAYEQALQIFRAVGEQRWEAIVLNNLGFAYYHLGESQRALAFFDQALPLRRQAGDARGEAFTLNNQALVHKRLGNPREAWRLNQQALELLKTAGNPLDRARTLTQMARLHIDMGEPGPALELADQALQLSPPEKDRHTAADALQLSGRGHLLSGRPGQARDLLGQALQLRRLAGDPVAQAESLTLLARAERRMEDLPGARVRLEEAVKVIESLRTRLSSPDLRSSFWSTQQQAYEQYIDLLMALHRAEPAAKHHRTALQISERARARTLIELLVEAEAEIRQGIPEDLSRRETDLRSRLNALTESRVKLLGNPGGEAEAGYLAQDIEAVLAQLDRLEAQIRLSNPAYAALTLPGPLEFSQIQGLIDKDTLLMEYALGEERSFLWCVSSDTVQAFELPGRPVIESAARLLHQRLSTIDLRSGRDEKEAAAALGRMLLEPAAGLMDKSRLVVVADGVLHYIPFAALPQPGSRSLPLLERFEVTYLPSASALAVQRRQLSGRPAAPRMVAVLADPVFEASDPRLSNPSAGESKAGADQSPRLERQAAAGRFERLPATRREARAIAGLAPFESNWMARDFDASRSNVLQDRLKDYRFVHFATHGLVDSRHPELSGLVLSRFDDQGQRLNGFLNLRDIYNVRLNADLVVLSGCQTALGEEIRGEGLVGLARGFMYAGAARVVASLWRLQDRTTADLMERFYRRLTQGDRPAQALRHAQLSIWRERGRSDPYYWAAFVLQGDWR